jgi:hypothetical protein
MALTWFSCVPSLLSRRISCTERQRIHFICMSESRYYQTCSVIPKSTYCPDLMVSYMKCGFAVIRDVLSKEHEDRMESFFLSETLKYLYLLFDEGHSPLRLKLIQRQSPALSGFQLCVYDRGTPNPSLQQGRETSICQETCACL